MSRRKRNYTREHHPDAKYGNVNLTKFMNRVMLDGKKSKAEGIIYGTLANLEEKLGKPAIEVFETCIRNVTPQMEVKSRRVGGSTYQVPIEVKRERGVALAMKWIVLNARSRKGASMIARLSSELMDAYNKVGSSIKKREEAHKMAESNKAFAHFRW